MENPKFGVVAKTGLEGKSSKGDNCSSCFRVNFPQSAVTCSNVYKTGSGGKSPQWNKDSKKTIPKRDLIYNNDVELLLRGHQLALDQPKTLSLIGDCREMASVPTKNTWIRKPQSATPLLSTNRLKLVNEQ